MKQNIPYLPELYTVLGILSVWTIGILADLKDIPYYIFAIMCFIIVLTYLVLMGKAFIHKEGGV